MITQDLLFGSEAKDALFKGVSKVAQAVAVTLGANGRNVIIDRNGMPHITKDGVTVARSITPTDPVEALGARILLDAANKTVYGSGDGTTTATVLARGIIQRGFEASEEKKVSVSVIKEGIDEAVRIAVEQIQTMTREVKSYEELKSIATVSANNDEAIGKIVADAIHMVGKEGDVSIEASRDTTTRVVRTEGMEIGYGWKSPMFITNQVKATSELQNCYVLLFDRSINDVKELGKIFEAVAMKAQQENRTPSLLVISEDVSDAILNTLLVNHINNKMKSCLVQIPVQGINRQVMDDIAIVCGGEVVSGEAGEQVGVSGPKKLGFCDKVIIKQGSTTFIGGRGDEKAVQARAIELAEAATQQSGHIADHTKRRSAKLIGGVAIIEVGGFSDVEILEKRDRLDDAINATKAANLEGYVIGGGATYLHCAEAIRNAAKQEKGDKAKGMLIVAEALSDPFVQILENADCNTAKDHAAHIASQPYGLGFNVKTGKIENFFNSGVIDPARVSRQALENAASAGKELISTACVVFNVPDPDLGMGL